MPTPATVPSCSVNLFDDRVLADPYSTYDALRRMGPVVHLDPHGMWAVPGYTEVQTILNDPVTFSWDGGVPLTAQAKSEALVNSVHSIDGEEHAHLRQALVRHLSSQAVAGLGEGFCERTRRLVAKHTEGGVFDAVVLARQLVYTASLSLMGVPESAQPTLLGGSDVFGPVNASLGQALLAATAIHAAMQVAVEGDAVAPDSLAGDLRTAVGSGNFTQPEATRLVCDYACASVETTICGLAETILRLAQDPVQWARLRQDPTRAEAALHEALRLDAPVQGRCRIVTQTTDLDGVRIEAGQQLWLLYGSTGRDERKWGTNADTYDLSRPFVDQHLVFGLGPSQSTGVQLAQIYASALLRALAARCTRLTLAGDPVRLRNSTWRGYASVPVAVEFSPTSTTSGSPVRRPR